MIAPLILCAKFIVFLITIQIYSTFGLNLYTIISAIFSIVLLALFISNLNKMDLEGPTSDEADIQVPNTPDREILAKNCCYSNGIGGNYHHSNGTMDSSSCSDGGGPCY